MDSVAPVINWSATSGTLALIFVWWHTWNYDRWRSVLFPTISEDHQTQRRGRYRLCILPGLVLNWSRCMVYRQEDWFRTIILYVHLIGLTFFVASQWMDVHVVYQQVSLLFSQLLYRLHLVSMEQRLISGWENVLTQDLGFRDDWY